MALVHSSGRVRPRTLVRSTQLAPVPVVGSSRRVVSDLRDRTCLRHLFLLLSTVRNFYRQRSTADDGTTEGDASHRDATWRAGFALRIYDVMINQPNDFAVVSVRPCALLLCLSWAHVAHLRTRLFPVLSPATVGAAAVSDQPESIASVGPTILVQAQFGSPGQTYVAHTRNLHARSTALMLTRLSCCPSCSIAIRNEQSHRKGGRVC